MTPFTLDSQKHQTPWSVHFVHANGPIRGRAACPRRSRSRYSKRHQPQQFMVVRQQCDIADGLGQQAFVHTSDKCDTYTQLSARKVDIVDDLFACWVAPSRACGNRHKKPIGVDEPAFHVVVQSLPDFVYSCKPAVTGWGTEKVAAAGFN